jgi:pimeloyl-ACP methyl ester carboxylesterase
MPSEEATAEHALPSSAIVNVNGVPLHVDRWQGGERAQLLLLHGLGGNSVTWHGVAPTLATALGARVVAVNLPGFGPSRPTAGGNTLRALARLTLELMRSEGLQGKGWILVGNSLGGQLALEVACRAPAEVRALSVLGLALPLHWGRGFFGLATLASWVAAAVPWLGRRMVASYVKRTGLPGVVDEPIRALFGDAARLDPELRERLLAVSAGRLGWADDAARAYEQTTRSLGVALLLSGRGRRWIREARCPVLALHGTRDPIFPAAAWRRLERARPDWEHVALPDIGHVPQLEAPREVTSALLRWLGRL